MALAKTKCGCWVHKKVPAGAQDVNYTYRCVKDGVVVQYPSFAAASQLKADLAACDMFNDPTQKYFEIPQGGHNCLPLDSLVHMAAGGTKAIVDIELGDEVVCGDYDDRISSAAVRGIAYELDVELVEIASQGPDRVLTSVDQSIVTSAGPVKADSIFPGAQVLTLDGGGVLQRDRFVVSTRTLQRQRGDVASLDIGDHRYFFVGPSRIAMRCGKIGDAFPIQK